MSSSARNFNIALTRLEPLWSESLLVAFLSDFVREFKRDLLSSFSSSSLSSMSRVIRRSLIYNSSVSLSIEVLKPFIFSPWWPHSTAAIPNDTLLSTFWIFTRSAFEALLGLDWAIYLRRDRDPLLTTDLYKLLLTASTKGTYCTCLCVCTD